MCPRPRTTLVIFLAFLGVIVAAAFDPPRAQLLNYDWSQGYGDGGSQTVSALDTDSFGRLVVIGNFTGTVDFGGGPLVNPLQTDPFLVKLASDGSHIWSKSFGDIGWQFGMDVANDPTNNVVFTGFFQNTIDLGGGVLTSVDEYDLFIAKFDAGGNHLWSHSFGDSMDQTTRGIAVSDGANIFVGGDFEGSFSFGGAVLTSAGSEDIFLARFDPAGNHLWSKSFGGVNREYFWDMATDAAGNVIIMGDFTGSIDFGGGLLTTSGTDVYVAKFDGAGNHVWSQVLGGTSTQTGYGLAVEPAGDMVVSGYFTTEADFGGGTLTAAGGTDLYALKLDASGAHVWSQRYGDTENQYNRGVDIDADGNVLLTGMFHGSLDFGGGALTSIDINDCFLAKLDEDGNHVWSESFPGDSTDAAADVTVDADGNVFVGGIFTSDIDLGGGPLAWSGHFDAYVGRFEKAEQFKPGDLYLVSRALPDGGGLYDGIVGIDPVTGAVSTLYEAETTVGQTLTWDAFRNMLVISQADSGIVGVDADGVATVLEGSSPILSMPLVAARGDGIIYVWESSSAEFSYVDATNTLNPLLDQAGTGTFGFPTTAGIRDIYYDEETNSLLGFTGVGAFPECPTNGETCAVKIPLNPAGTQVVGTVTSVSVDVVPGLVEDVFGVSAYYAPGEILIFLGKNTAPGHDIIQHLDAVSMTMSTFATPSYAGDNGTRGGAYSACLDKAVLNDTVFNIIRSFAYGDSAVPGDTVAVGTSGVGTNEAARMVEIPNGCPPSGIAGMPSPINRAPQLDVYPNPFNPTTTIRFELERAGNVRIDVFDVGGRRVQTLLNEHRGAGQHRVQWRGRNERGTEVASGVYFVRLQSASGVATQRMVLIR